ncbi:MAG: hypothetical protein Q4F95_03555 [Oscillospiraceae bacterium]|nr:hypothetical protein [Oscillospiraceae bacterium]
MDKKLKQKLSTAYDLESSEKRDRFLKDLHYPKMNIFDFVLAQFAYIRKRVWLAAACFLLLTVCGLDLINETPNFIFSQGIISAAAAAVPYLCLLSAAEISRSSRCLMTDIEAGCRFGLSHLILARMLILGVYNILVLIISVLIFSSFYGFDIFITTLRIFVPFTAVSALSLYSINHFPSLTDIYVCAVIAVLTSIIIVLSGSSFNYETNRLCISAMITALAAGAFLAAVECRQIIRKQEDRQWNLKLTQ